jgi:hypothetical protein
VDGSPFLSLSFFDLHDDLVKVTKRQIGRFLKSLSNRAAPPGKKVKFLFQALLPSISGYRWRNALVAVADVFGASTAQRVQLLGCGLFRVDRRAVVQSLEAEQCGKLNRVGLNRVSQGQKKTGSFDPV